MGVAPDAPGAAMLKKEPAEASHGAAERLGDELEARSKLLRVELNTAAGAKKTCEHGLGLVHEQL